MEADKKAREKSKTKHCRMCGWIGRSEIKAVTNNTLSYQSG